MSETLWECESGVQGSVQAEYTKLDLSVTAKLWERHSEKNGEQHWRWGGPKLIQHLTRIQKRGME